MDYSFRVASDLMLQTAGSPVYACPSRREAVLSQGGQNFYQDVESLGASPVAARIERRLPFVILRVNVSTTINQ